MAAFRVVDPFEVFTDNLGNPCAGGSLVFYDTLTTTAKSVYSDQALSVNLGNTLTLNSAGRATTDVWGSGTYRILLKNSSGVTQEDVDPVLEQGAAGSAIPTQTGNSGEFLTTNGSVMSWAAVAQIPDMTGQSGKLLGTDGTSALWQSPATIAIPALPASGVSHTTTEFRVGTLLCKVGSGTFPASGTQASSVVVTFAGTAFNAAPQAVFIQMGPGASMYLHPRVDSSTATTVNLSCDSNIIGELITATQSFKYLAIGPTA